MSRNVRNYVSTGDDGTRPQGEPPTGIQADPRRGHVDANEPRRPPPRDGFEALRARTVPTGVLDGLYEEVRARAALAPPGGGMSAAFLDAPRALRTWRMVAVAAMVLLAVGWSVAFTGAEGPDPSPAAVRPGQTLVPSGGALAERPLVELPAGMLEEWGVGSRRATRIYAPRRAGDPRFFAAPASGTRAAPSSSTPRWD